MVLGKRGGQWGFLTLKKPVVFKGNSLSTCTRARIASPLVITRFFLICRKNNGCEFSLLATLTSIRYRHSLLDACLNYHNADYVCLLILMTVILINKFYIIITWVMTILFSNMSTRFQGDANFPTRD